MSYIRIPARLEGKLPSIPSIVDDEAHAPIEVTMWKCRRQVMGTLVVCIGIFGIGSIFGWPTVAIPALKQDHAIEDSAAIEASIASIFILGAMFSGPAAGYLMYKVGRKLATFYFSLICSIGWMFIPAAYFIGSDNETKETLLLIGRFVTGFAGAGCLVIGPVYVQEIVDDGIRTAMGSLVPLIMVLGNTVCFALGPFVKWWQLSIMCTAVPVLLCVLIWWIPNSPRHLLSIGKDEEAHKAVVWLTVGFTEDEQERTFKKLKRGVEILNKNNNRAMKKADRKQLEKRLQLKLKSRPVLHPLIISILLIFFQQASGNNVIGTYTIDILDKGKNTVSASTGMVIFGICYFLVVIFATLVVERLGRKPLLLVGLLLMFLMQVILGVFFYFLDANAEYALYMEEHFSWIPITTSILFIVGYAIGIGTVTWILSVEINHPDFQEIAGSLNSLTYWVTAFVSMMTLPCLRAAIHYHWCFWLYSFMDFLAFWYCLFFIYETKGKSQDDIMAHYKGQAYGINGEEGDGDSKSIGSILSKPSHGSGAPRQYRKSAGDAPRKQSTGSDWSTDLETIFETEHQDIN